MLLIILKQANTLPEHSMHLIQKYQHEASIKKKTRSKGCILWSKFFIKLKKICLTKINADLIRKEEKQQRRDNWIISFYSWANSTL